MKNHILPVLALLSTPAFAVVNIEYVDVGHAGNAADPATGSIYGAVSYAYKIGKYEVTNAQYTEFLNAVDPSGVNANGIYNSSMGSDDRGGITYTAGAASGTKYTIRTNMGDKPVNYVSWYDAARFTNWLHNGQGSGSTASGVYDMRLAYPVRSLTATVWLPSVNEWYKAAYYDPTSGAEAGGDNYWFYATQSNIPPLTATASTVGDISNPGTNVVNFNYSADWNGQDGNVTTVGSAVANNYFGTADQNGNVQEWNELIIGSNRGLRGGAFTSNWTHLEASNNGSTVPTYENAAAGFRVATIPEPSAVLLTLFSASASLARRRRKSP